MRRFALLAPLLLAVGPALAADYEPPMILDDAPEYVPVEVGSGWYLRGDIGAAILPPFEHQEFDGLEEDSSLLVGSVGVGFNVNSFLRTELNFGVLPSDDFSADFESICQGNETTTVVDNLSGILIFQNTDTTSRPCPGSDNGSNEAYSLLASAFVDLGTYVGITPFVGAGAGVVYTKLRSAIGERDCRDSSIANSSGLGTTTTVDFECFEDELYEGVVESKGEYNVAFSLAGGLSYQMTQNASVDLGYEYISVPGADYVVYNDDGPEVEEGIDFHQVKIGVRYDLW